jgi:hypothetical protein
MRLADELLKARGAHPHRERTSAIVLSRRRRGGRRLIALALVEEGVHVASIATCGRRG